MALHVRHRTPCDAILMLECACLQLKAIVAYYLLVIFALVMFCYALLAL